MYTYKEAFSLFSLVPFIGHSNSAKTTLFFPGLAFTQIQLKECCSTLPTANSIVTLASPTDFLNKCKKLEIKIGCGYSGSIWGL